MPLFRHGLAGRSESPTRFRRDSRFMPLTYHTVFYYNIHNVGNASFASSFPCAALRHHFTAFSSLDKSNSI